MVPAVALVEVARGTLKIEVTESLAVNDIQKIIEILTAVRQIGVRIAMDDFGTGYSSLQYLKRLPIEQLKIDQGFVRDLAVDVVVAVDGAIEVRPVAPDERADWRAGEAATARWLARLGALSSDIEQSDIEQLGPVEPAPDPTGEES